MSLSQVKVFGDRGTNEWVFMFPAFEKGEGPVNLIPTLSLSASDPCPFIIGADDRLSLSIPTLSLSASDPCPFIIGADDRLSLSIPTLSLSASDPCPFIIGADDRLSLSILRSSL